MGNMKTTKFNVPEGAFRPLDEEEAELMAASASGILEISETSEADKVSFEAAAKNALKRKKIIFQPIRAGILPPEFRG